MWRRDSRYEASKIAYDLSKTTAQSCLLINGGAATAVLALLAKDHVDAAIVRYVPWALGVMRLVLRSAHSCSFAL